MGMDTIIGKGKLGVLDNIVIAAQKINRSPSQPAGDPVQQR